MAFPIPTRAPIALLAIVAGTLSPLAAGASLFGKKQPVEDFTVARPLPVPVASPATGSIFQAQDGYAALYEGWRARKVGDPLTIVLVERTAASKSSGGAFLPNRLASTGDAPSPAMRSVPASAAIGALRITIRCSG